MLRFKSPNKCSDSLAQPFNSSEWPRQNFSLLYLIVYIIMQTSDENKEKY